MSATVEIKELGVELSGTRILDGVDLTVPAGSFVTLLGPSGSGKTTTLNVLAGFVAATSGEVLLGGRPLGGVPVGRRDIGFVFQNYALFPHLNVARNIEFPLLARKVGRQRRREMVATALELVQLPGTGDRAVSSLSGGQQQRVALARALVFGPALLLLDEPLAALDKQLREAMQIELKRIQRETGTTTVAVTHDQVEALSMSDLVAIMQDGRIEQVGTPEEVYRRPATPFVAGFLGEANLLPVRGGRCAAFGLPVEGAAEGVTVLRPEDFVLTAAVTDGAVGGTVTETVYQGARLRLSVTVDDCARPLVVSVLPGEHPVAPAAGDRIGLRHRGGGTLRTLADPPPARTAPAAHTTPAAP
ncbi:ABC transporter ATP-binding protein [Spirillospora sp. NPDC047279]|uniref:ABC transporter ATP-binding protein n=1 Tax=Spirillospora sp. NPDC047279 TaxID=3155478 RepID=UPI0033E8E106